MTIDFKSWLPHLTAVLVGVCVANGVAAGAGKPHYLVTNDDVPPALTSSVTFYAVGADGQLTTKAKVSTGQGGIAGGYFAANRVNVLDSGKGECVYASQALNGEIVGIPVKTLRVAGHANGSKKDTGASNGIGLAMNAKYLYASFTDSSNIGTFRVQPGCGMKFVGDLSVKGLQGGVIDGMVIHGNIMIVTYGDNSIESFNISGTQFNGLTHGAAYGDDAQMNSSYTLVRITNNATKHVIYARTHNPSTMAVATGTKIVSTNFVVPKTAEAGASSLVVVANGIPSAPVNVTVQ